MAESERSGVAALLRAAGLGPSASGLWRDRESQVGARVLRTVVVGWIDIVWPHPATPAETLRDEVAVDLHSDPAVAMAELERAIESARRARARHVRVCGVCSRSFVPGHMHDDTLCQGCAEREQGVVH